MGELTTLTEALRDFETVVSDKDLHFTGSIAQNAREDENLSILGDKIKICSLMLVADQNLDFEVWFWGKDNFAHADLDAEKPLAIVLMDLSRYGKQLGGIGQYYLTVEGLDIFYRDLDATNELHVSLVNRSATAKNAGATGEVVLHVLYKN